MIISPTSAATQEQPLVDDPDCMKQISVDRVWETYTDIVKEADND